MQKRLASFLFSFGLGLIILTLAAGHISFWGSSGFTIISSTGSGLLLAALFILTAAVAARFRVKELELDLFAFLAVLALLFFSDVLNRPYSFFPGPTVRGEILLFTLLFLFFPLARSRWFWSGALLTTVLLCLGVYYRESAGRLLISDDHSVFFFRFTALRDNFPYIPFFYPLWNGGIDARDFFATGSLGAFLLGAPLIYFFELTKSYTWVVALIIFLLLPVSVYFSARLQKLAQPAPVIAALLALTTGLIWYRWALKYGTLGFITTSALIPLNFALLSRWLDEQHRPSLKEVLFMSLSISVMLFWTPAVLVFAPLALYSLWHLRTLVRKKHFVLLVTLLFVINAPWVAMFAGVSKVGSFISAEQKKTPAENAAPRIENGKSASEPLAQAARDEHQSPAFRHKAGRVNLKKSLKIFRETSVSTNPLLIFLALPGIFLVPRGRTRIVLIATSIWLLTLGSLAVPLKPQLELDRMLVIFCILACAPVAALLLQAWRSSATSWQRGLSALGAGFLLCGPFCSANMLANRTLEHYHFANGALTDLANAITSFSGSGRVLFTGTVLHELDEGHLAPLTVLTQKPLYASSPFHNIWRYTQPIPKSFIERGEPGIEEFFDLFNVTSVVAHEKEWREYFNARPHRYEFLWRGGRFNLYKRQNAGSTWIFSGTGELVAQTGNSIIVRAQSPELVLKFNYFPFLQSSDCRLSPRQVAPEVTLIKLEDCPPGKEIVINSIPPHKRLKLEFGK